MKHIYLLLFSLLAAGIAAAQTQPPPDPAPPAPRQTPNDPYTILSGSFGNVFLRHPGRTFSVSFPYYSNGRNGTFSGAFSDSIPTRISMIDLPNIEVMDGPIGINFGCGLNRDLLNDYALYVKAAFKASISLNGLQIRPGFDLYYLLGSNETLGSIDNKNTEIDLLGFQALENWTETTTDDDGYTSTDTYYADHLDVDYKRSSLVFTPNLTFTINPVGKLFFNIEAGYFLQLQQSSRINILQWDNSGNEHKLGSLHMQPNGSFGGPYLAVSVGFALDRRATPKRR